MLVFPERDCDALREHPVLQSLTSQTGSQNATMEIVEAMSESLWRMTREKAFDVVKHAIIRSRREERAQSERWRPSRGAEYWYISDTGVVDNNRWEEDRFDTDRWDMGNVFRTKQDAEQARDGMKEYFAHFHKEHG
jgi:hypothetical protein